jgi:murein L,D-transpeptidase YafK
MKVLLFLFAFFCTIVPNIGPQLRASPINSAELSITVFKTAHQLWLYKDNEAIKRYRIFLGSSPIGDKIKRGDNRTPEGNYRVIEKNADSKFHRFITINYPNVKDADIAYDEGRLTAFQWVDILYASSKGTKPPWNTPLGGFLGIHGIGENEQYKLQLIGDTDWTNGCIALTNREVDELFRLIPLGTLVRIRK